ncbi:MAG: HNH endonuclease [Candidatus Methanomethylophilaceae archaeon]|nr:HNH endonuclease [Candidatus Methanomethylophilaceae archaeon]
MIVYHIVLRTKDPQGDGGGILIGFVVVAVLFLIVLVVIAGKALSYHRDAFVREHSQMLRDVDCLNQSFRFDDIGEQVLTRVLESKAQFDRFDPDLFVSEHISGDMGSYLDLLDSADGNRALYEEYSEIYDRITSGVGYDYIGIVSQGRMIDTDLFRRLEGEMVREMKLNPVTSLSVTVDWSYTSPAGRNRYRDSRMYSQDDIIGFIEEGRRREQYRNSVQYERSVAAGLRYDVLKRDGFRCVLCGASRADGIKLHVDHVIPVSKGGRSTMDNLRTLCEECNLGKGDKYDPSGENRLGCGHHSIPCGR